uniref:PAP2 family protein n=1 Tax=uncultured bacterium Contig21 TaxID=1393535 RepID=W0FPG4_9BACT|nr:PAP2 family protein [uncultured bacterium Contig21]
MGNIFYFQWEVDLIQWVQNTMGSAGTALAKVFSFIGGETMSLLLLIIMLFCYKKAAGKRVALTVLTASMWFPMIKNVVLRVRPYMAHRESIEVLQVVEADADPMDIIQQGFSFPSGHGATAVSLFGSIGRELRKRWMWTLAIVMPLLIGLSRIAVGVHYPTDVLAGWAVGLAAIGFNMLLVKYVKKEWVRYVILLALTVPGIFWCTSRDYFTALGLLIAAAVAFPYEEKYVKFQDTRNVWAMILRAAGSFAIYFALNTLLKMPFSKEWLDSGELAANLVRTARYAVILFVIIGVYPRVFPVLEKVGKSNS